MTKEPNKVGTREVFENPDKRNISRANKQLREEQGEEADDGSAKSGRRAEMHDEAR